MPFDDDEEETPNIEFNQPSGTIVTHGNKQVSLTQNFGTDFREVLPLMMSEYNKQISEERNRSMNLERSVYHLERSVYRLEPHIKNMVRKMKDNDIPLTTWLKRHGYTDPDAEWDFPPLDSEN
jgi:hypothetical protein